MTRSNKKVTRRIRVTVTVEKSQTPELKDVSSSKGKWLRLVTFVTRVIVGCCVGILVRAFLVNLP